MKKLLLGMIFIALNVTGCSVVRKQINDKDYTPSNPQTKMAEEQLIETANSIDQSLQTLAASQAVTPPPVINIAPLTTPEGGMGGTADIDWTGPIGPLLTKIADMTNYRLKTLGNEPAIPIIVTITAKNAIVAEILQNGSLQAGKRASIMVFPSSKVIELRYLTP